jgi:hypothetical protein
MPKKATAYIYGASKNPASWQETAAILKNLKPKKHTSSGLMEKIDQLLKERKG